MHEVANVHRYTLLLHSIHSKQGVNILSNTTCETTVASQIGNNNKTKGKKKLRVHFYTFCSFKKRIYPDFVNVSARLNLLNYYSETKFIKCLKNLYKSNYSTKFMYVLFYTYTRFKVYFKVRVMVNFL